MPNLVEKLVKAFKRVDTILKQGDNGEYAYLRILDIANEVRQKLMEEGVLIIPSDVTVDIEHRDVSDLPRVMSYAVVKTEFTITDGTQTLGPFASYGFDKDMDGKCVMIAETAALKSFLKRATLIFGDYDDPEIERDNIADKRPDLQRKIDEQTRISQKDVRAFYAACKKSGRTLEEIRDYLDAIFRIVDVTQIEQKDLQAAMKWAFKEEVEDGATRMDS